MIQEVLLLGSAQCSLKNGDVPINMAPSKKKEKVQALLAMVLMWFGCSSLLGSCLPNYTQYHVPK